MELVTLDKKEVHIQQIESGNASALMRAVCLNNFRRRLMKVKIEGSDQEYIRVVNRDIQRIENLISQIDYELTPKSYIQ